MALRNFREYRDILGISILFFGYHFYLLTKISPFETLWAEDGRVFITQSLALGWKAIFVPYAGYLHFDLRLVALLASFFDIKYTPIIFLVFWLVCYFSFFLVLRNFIKNRDENDFTLFAISFLVLSQISSGETLFNLTNSHFFIAAATVLYLLTLNDDVKISFWKFLLIFSFAVTGPFSVLLLPVLVVKTIFFKDWRTKKFFYIPVLLGAVIQISFIAFSSRISGEIDHNLLHWGKALLNVFCIPEVRQDVRFWISIYWLVYFGSLGYFSYKLDKKTDLKTIAVIFTFTSIYLVAMFYSSKASPISLSVIKGGGRYFFILYTFFYICLILFTDKYSKTRYLLFIIASVVNIECYYSPIKGRNNLNYLQYVDAFKANATNTIPINPSGWFISKVGKEFDGRKINLLEETNYKKRCITFKNSASCSTFYEISKFCPNSSSLALSMIYRGELIGNIELGWSFADNNFSEQNTLKLSKNNGIDQRLNFAFPAKVEAIKVSGQALDEGKLEVTEITLFCL